MDIIDTDITDTAESSWKTDIDLTVYCEGGSVWEYDGIINRESLVDEKISDFDPSSCSWVHVDGPDPDLGKGSADTDSTSGADNSDGTERRDHGAVWTLDEMSGQLDCSWGKGRKRRAKITRDDIEAEGLFGWHEASDLEGETIEVDGTICTIDGFGGDFWESGDQSRYVYVIVPEGEGLKGGGSSKRTTTGPGGCPSCGGPTSVAGERCDGCRR